MYKYADETAETQSRIFPLGCFKDYKPLFSEYTYTCDYPERNEYHYIEYIRLKITAKFKSADLSKDIVYTRVYAIKNVSSIQLLPFEEQLPAFDCTTFTPPATASEIAAVCNSAQYQNRASQYLRASGTSDDLNQVRPNVINGTSDLNNYSFNVTPNPVGTAPGIATIKMAESGSLKVYLTDATGTVIKTLINTWQGKGLSSVKVDFSMLPKGIYFAVMETNKGKITKKIMRN